MVNQARRQRQKQAKLQQQQKQQDSQRELGTTGVATSSGIALDQQVAKHQLQQHRPAHDDARHDLSNLYICCAPLEVHYCSMHPCCCFGGPRLHACLGGRGSEIPLVSCSINPCEKVVLAKSVHASARRHLLRMVMRSWWALSFGEFDSEQDYLERASDFELAETYQTLYLTHRGYEQQQHQHNLDSLIYGPIQQQLLSQVLKRWRLFSFDAQDFIEQDMDSEHDAFGQAACSPRNGEKMDFEFGPDQAACSSSEGDEQLNQQVSRATKEHDEVQTLSNSVGDIMNSAGLAIPEVCAIELSQEAWFYFLRAVTKVTLENICRERPVLEHLIRRRNLVDAVGLILQPALTTFMGFVINRWEQIYAGDDDTFEEILSTIENLDLSELAEMLCRELACADKELFRNA